MEFAIILLIYGECSKCTAFSDIFGQGADLPSDCGLFDVGNVSYFEISFKYKYVFTFYYHTIPGTVSSFENWENAAYLT